MAKLGIVLLLAMIPIGMIALALQLSGRGVDPVAAGGSEMKVVGRRIELSEGRIVFVGSCENEPGSVFIGIRSGEGVERFMTFSSEGAEALGKLLTDETIGTAGPFPTTEKTEWRVVRPKRSRDETA